MPEIITEPTQPTVGTQPNIELKTASVVRGEPILVDVSGVEQPRAGAQTWIKSKVVETGTEWSTLLTPTPYSGGKSNFGTVSLDTRNMELGNYTINVGTKSFPVTVTGGEPTKNLEYVIQGAYGEPTTDWQPMLTGIPITGPVEFLFLKEPLEEGENKFNVTIGMRPMGSTDKFINVRTVRVDTSKTASQLTEERWPSITNKEMYPKGLAGYTDLHGNVFLGSEYKEPIYFESVMKHEYLHNIYPQSSEANIRTMSKAPEVEIASPETFNIIGKTSLGAIEVQSTKAGVTEQLNPKTYEAMFGQPYEEMKTSLGTIKSTTTETKTEPTTAEQAKEYLETSKVYNPYTKGYYYSQPTEIIDLGKLPTGTATITPVTTEPISLEAPKFMTENFTSEKLTMTGTQTSEAQKQAKSIEESKALYIASSPFGPAIAGAKAGAETAVGLEKITGIPSEITAFPLGAYETATRIYPLAPAIAGAKAGAEVAKGLEEKTGIPALLTAGPIGAFQTLQTIGMGAVALGQQAVEHPVETIAGLGTTALITGALTKGYEIITPKEPIQAISLSEGEAYVPSDMKVGQAADIAGMKSVATLTQGGKQIGTAVSEARGTMKKAFDFGETTGYTTTGEYTTQVIPTQTAFQKLLGGITGSEKVYYKVIEMPKEGFTAKHVLKDVSGTFVEMPTMSEAYRIAKFQASKYGDVTINVLKPRETAQDIAGAIRTESGKEATSKALAISTTKELTEGGGVGGMFVREGDINYGVAGRETTSFFNEIVGGKGSIGLGTGVSKALSFERNVPTIGTAWKMAELGGGTINVFDVAKEVSGSAGGTAGTISGGLSTATKATTATTTAGVQGALDALTRKIGVENIPTPQISSLEIAGLTGLATIASTKTEAKPTLNIVENVQKPMGMTGKTSMVGIIGKEEVAIEKPRQIVSISNVLETKPTQTMQTITLPKETVDYMKVLEREGYITQKPEVTIKVEKAVEKNLPPHPFEQTLLPHPLGEVTETSSPYFKTDVMEKKAIQQRIVEPESVQKLFAETRFSQVGQGKIVGLELEQTLGQKSEVEQVSKQFLSQLVGQTTVVDVGVRQTLGLGLGLDLRQEQFIGQRMAQSYRTEQKTRQAYTPFHIPSITFPVIPTTFSRLNLPRREGHARKEVSYRTPKFTERRWKVATGRQMAKIIGG